MARRPTCSPTDVDAYLEAHEHKGLLRFITCGSVDDGKSTLIGRLLYESQMLFEDQLAALEADSTQGRHAGRRARLRAARSTAWPPSASRASRSTSPTASSRPTGASSSSPTRRATSSTRATWSPAPRPPTCAVILVDARKGVLTQTRRHSYLVSLLGIRHVVLAVNKMDLVDYSQETLRRDRARLPRVRARRSGSSDVDAASRCRRCAATTSSTPSDADAVVRRADAAGVPRDGRGRRRAAAARAVPAAGAVGEPARTSTSAASPARSPAARVAPGRRGRACCRPGSESTVERDRHASTATSTARSPASR